MKFTAGDYRTIFSMTRAAALSLIAVTCLLASAARADFNVGSGSTLTVGAGSIFNTTGSISLDGVLDASGVIELSGNWNKAGIGIFVPNVSTVTFTETSASSVTGNTTFYVLQSTWPGKIMRFQNGFTQTVSNALNVSGSGSSGEIWLLSTADGQKWGIRVPGAARNVHHVRVKDSDAFDNTITASSSTDDGNNNAFWIFDVLRPSAITDLTALAGIAPGTILLNWTAPGDDGTTGTATSYLIKMSTALELAPALSESEFSAAQNVNSTSTVPAPLASGSSIQFVLVTGLLQNVTYYFAMRAVDDVSLGGNLSPGATAVAPGTILSVYLDSDTYNFGIFTAVQSTISARPIVVSNGGNTAQRYSIGATTATSGTPWTLSTSRGSDTVAVNALFNSSRPGDVDFEAVASTLDYTQQVSGTNGGQFAGNQTGAAVPMSVDRNLWFRLGMPLSTSTTEEQLVQVTVTAEVEP